METKFIRYCENWQIAEHIKWLAKMGDMMLPDDAKEFIGFLQLSFGKFDISLLPKAFGFWAAGNLPSIRPVKAINMFFVSSILNAYLDVNGRLIPTEPKKFIESPKNDVKSEIDYNQLLVDCKNDVIAMENNLRTIYFSRWGNYYKHIQNEMNENFEVSEIESVVNKIVEYSKRVLELNAKQNPKSYTVKLVHTYNEVSKAENYLIGLQDSAKFYILVKRGLL
jgi:hypothetical protein